MTKRIADQLTEDPRVQQARELLLSAVGDHSQQIDGIRPPVESLAKELEEKLNAFGEMRGGNLYYPYISSGIGNGPYVELLDGSVKLDFITGIGVHGYGHSHPDLVDAAVDAALCDTVMQGNLQQNDQSVSLVDLLIKTARKNGSPINHCFLTTSGAMANENSLKIAFQKRFPASRILGFKKCFAGRTLALAQITDRAKYRDGLPVAIDVDQLTFYDHRDPKGSTQRTLDEIAEHTERYPGQHAALWIELIQGEGGYYPASEEYLHTVLQACREHKIAIIDDEVQTFGRTTEPYAFQHFGLDKLVDIVTIGKISQVCATLYTEEYKPRPGLISQTFTGSSWAILASQKILNGLIANGNFGADGKNMKLHEYFVAGLKKIGEKYPGSIGGPHGLGGMLAITPFDGSMEKAKELGNELYHAGLMSFIAGGDPARLRFLMPIGSVNENHIDEACAIIDKVIAKMAS